MSASETGPMRGRAALRAVLAAIAAAALAASAALAQPATGTTTDMNAIIRSLAPRAPADRAGPAEPIHRSIDLVVAFALGSARLTPAARRQLDELGKALRSSDLAGATFEIAGHTDASGGNALNKALSLARARAVKAYLVEAHHVDAARLEATGYGEDRLKDPLHPRGAVNRRVEVIARAAPARAPRNPSIISGSDLK